VPRPEAQRKVVRAPRVPRPASAASRPCRRAMSNEMDATHQRATASSAPGKERIKPGDPWPPPQRGESLSVESDPLARTRRLAFNSAAAGRGLTPRQPQFPTQFPGGRRPIPPTFPTDSVRIAMRDHRGSPSASVGLPTSGTLRTGSPLLSQRSRLGSPSPHTANRTRTC
jgi:hypothetical protein